MNKAREQKRLVETVLFLTKLEYHRIVKKISSNKPKLIAKF